VRSTISELAAVHVAVRRRPGAKEALPSLVLAAGVRPPKLDEAFPRERPSECRIYRFLFATRGAW
jgi:hypothetical protein